MEYFNSFQSYHFIVHSFGSYIALKLAEKLEANGKTGEITFIDAAPALLKSYSLTRYKNSSDEQIQNNIIENLTLVVWGRSIDVKPITTLLTWEEKINQILAHVTDQQIYGKEYLRLILNALFNRTKIVLNTDTKISSLTKSQATLIRPSIPFSPEDIDEKYELQLNFKENVELMYLEGNHFTVLDNPLLLKILSKTYSKLKN